MAATKTDYKKRKTVRTHCSCGQCPTCTEDERWERIFQKFVDPFYYKQGISRHSPIQSFQQ